MPEPGTSLDSHATRVISSHPLASVVSLIDGVCTEIPLVLARSGRTLIGHLPKIHPHLDSLGDAAGCLAIFRGPEGYLSPAFFRNQNQAPTWNYASVHVTVQIELSNNPESIRQALGSLVEHMESAHGGWELKQMRERYQEQAAMLVALTATITSYRSRFKMGQDESEERFHDSLNQMSSTDPLAQWMRRLRGS